MTSFVVALLVSFVVTPLVAVGARRWALIDEPNHRSSHVVPVPRGGGLAIVVASVVALVGWDRSSAVIGLAVGAVIVGAVGLVDDRFGLSAGPRLLTQLAVPVVVALLVLDRSGWRLGIAAAVAAVAVAAYVNAFNFMDGINGISASQAAIVGVFLAAIADHVGATSLRIAGLAVCGAALGFLPHNAVRPRIFLGDVGSYFLGFWLAGLALLLLDAGVAAAVLLGPFLLYLMDTASVLIKRARRGERLTEAHREHAYQRLTQAGWSHLAVAGVCAAISALCSIIMFSVVDARMIGQLAALAGCATLVTGYLLLPDLVHHRGNAS